MSPRPRQRGKTLLVVLLLSLVPFAALAQTSTPTFPALTGRVVDAADILPPAIETALDGKLAALEASTERQLVVATLPSLQGYEIEEYGYRLGRAWGLGREKQDDGLILLVAPSERRVRIEVGYGLEGEVTDAVSSRILTTAVLPRFRDGDFPGGIVAGTDALIELLSLPEGEAQDRVQAAEAAQAAPAFRLKGGGLPAILFAVIVLIVIVGVLRGGRSAFRRGRPSRSDWIVPAILWAASQRSSGGGSGWSGGGGGSSWGGGGGFSGGGGSFGGGGASGSW